MRNFLRSSTPKNQWISFGLGEKQKTKKNNNQREGREREKGGESERERERDIIFYFIFLFSRLQRSISALPSQRITGFRLVSVECVSLL